MRAFFCPPQVINSPSYNNFPTMSNKVLQDPFQRQDFRSPIYNGQHDNPERGFHLRKFIQPVKDHKRLSVPFYFYNDPHPVSIRFIPYIRYTLYLFFPNQCCHFLQEFTLVYLIRYLRDHHSFPGLSNFLYERPGPDLNDTPTRSVRLTNPFFAQDKSGCWKIRSKNNPYQLVQVNVRFINHPYNGIAYL